LSLLQHRHARTPPPRLTLPSLALASPYLFIDRAPSGVFPLTLLFPTAPPPAAGAGSSGLAAAIEVERFAVSDGRIDFRDLTLTPPYWRSLGAFELTASRTALPRPRVARFRGKGLVDQLPPLRFAGS